VQYITVIVFITDCLSVDTALSTDGSDLETQKLQLEMKLLDKQSTVLDLQLEELKVEKAYFDKQLAAKDD
jgi:hypothetical protein